MFSPPSATRSSATVRLKEAEPSLAPAGMVMVKVSGAAVKSALPAVSAATDTGIWRGVARTGSPGRVIPGTEPGRKAVTVTSVIREAAPEPLSSLMR